jgi:hypothetical protein
MMSYPQKTATADHLRLREFLAGRRPNYEHLIIGVDGLNGAGKTHLANWIGWQFGISTLHLDLYRRNGGGWFADEIGRILALNSQQDRSIVVEGVQLLDALAAAGVEAPSIYIYVDRAEDIYNELPSVTDYTHRVADRIGHADFRLRGYEAVPENEEGA